MKINFQSIQIQIKNFEAINKTVICGLCQNGHVMSIFISLALISMLEFTFFAIKFEYHFIFTARAVEYIYSIHLILF